LELGGKLAVLEVDGDVYGAKGGRIEADLGAAILGVEFSAKAEDDLFEDVFLGIFGHFLRGGGGICAEVGIEREGRGGMVKDGGGGRSGGDRGGGVGGFKGGDQLGGFFSGGGIEGEGDKIVIERFGKSG